MQPAVATTLGCDNSMRQSCVLTHGVELEARVKLCMCVSIISEIKISLVQVTIQRAGPSKRQKIAGPVARSIGECVAAGVRLLGIECALYFIY